MSEVIISITPIPEAGHIAEILEVLAAADIPARQEHAGSSYFTLEEGTAEAAAWILRGMGFEAAYLRTRRVEYWWRVAFSSATYTSYEVVASSYDDAELVRDVVFRPGRDENVTIRVQRGVIQLGAEWTHEDEEIPLRENPYVLLQDYEDFCLHKAESTLKKLRQLKNC